jgi:hypothetical protein
LQGCISKLMATILDDRRFKENLDIAPKVRAPETCSLFITFAHFCSLSHFFRRLLINPNPSPFPAFLHLCVLLMQVQSVRVQLLTLSEIFDSNR